MLPFSAPFFIIHVCGRLPMAMATGIPDYLFGRLKLILSGAAERTFPTIGKIFKCCTGSNAVLFIADSGIVYITAYFTFVLHSILLSGIEKWLIFIIIIPFGIGQ